MFETALMKFLTGLHSTVRFLVPPANIRLGRKLLTIANILAYQATVLITYVKSFIVQATGVNLI